MFKRILIANRGEIACRIIDSCRKLGVETVAVYSDADAASRHAAMADEAIHIGASAPAQSYLRPEAIIRAARESGAEAIHPGYGFLSENPEFVEAVEEAGLVFIGPSAEAIRAMGLKDAAKALMEQAGVPVVPGYHGADQDNDLLAREAAALGYPVLIKAVAGGGGKGMRRVDGADDFAESLASARAESRSAFGNDAVLIEKFITSPRHIEVQVFGDGQRALHLFERDCSLQRRHQKVIEEAPAPGMPEAVRAAMGAAATRAAEAIGYAGAGTVEFIVDGAGGLREDGFWFMEMNTRLQVEHPVTEEITGVDLVEWQLRVAAGEGMPLAQEEVSIDGHSFEARLYAEDVPAGFLPATGRLDHLQFPPGSRAETGVRAGDSISPYYDPMIAKIIVHGPDRPAALRTLQKTLRETEVAGTVTNLAFLHALACHPDFAAGTMDTGLIERDLDHLTCDKGIQPSDIAQAAIALLPMPEEWAGACLWEPLTRGVTLSHDGTQTEASVVVFDSTRQMVTTCGQVFQITHEKGGMRINGRKARPAFVASGCITIFDGQGRELRLIDPLNRVAEGRGGDHTVSAPMPGIVTAIDVIEGASVLKDERLAVMEAMKMEHSLRSPRDGVIAQIFAKEGDQLDSGAILIELEPLPDG